MSAPAIAIAAEAKLTERELRAWRGLLRAHAALVKRLDAELEEAHGLPLSSYEVLGQLESAPDRRMRMCDLADSVLLSRSGLTRLADRLERDGLIRRVCCTNDGRGSFAVLTDRGAHRLREARPTHGQCVRRDFAAHFSPQELETLALLWRRLLPELERQDLTSSD